MTAVKDFMAFSFEGTSPRHPAVGFAFSWTASGLGEAFGSILVHEVEGILPDAHGNAMSVPERPAVFPRVFRRFVSGKGSIFTAVR
jgi:hypothetical protein